MKGLELVCDISRDVPEVLVGDPTRLRQIIINLVGNAIKFTESGEISLRVFIEVLEPNLATIHFTVTDTGIGIPKNKLGRIFEPFTQADGSTTRKFGGTGLGLAISSHLVGLMCGKIWAESSIGLGSIFHFTAQFGLPVIPHTSITLPDMAFIRNLLVLVVEDNSTTRNVLVDMLDQIGIQPTAVDGTERAMAELQRLASTGNPYPLVLVDATLPGSDGFTFVEMVLQQQLAGTAALMLSSANLSRDVDRCEQIGAVAHLQKPVKRADLLRVLRGVIDPTNVSRILPVPASRPVPHAGPSGLTVLVVEDNVFNQKVAAMKLERWGNRVQVVGTGRAALAAIDEVEFDLILTDIQMPDMDGYELTAAIRHKQATRNRHLPIVAMTAHAMKGDRERCLAAGMDGYVSKPICDENLLETIKQLCQYQSSSVEETSSYQMQDTDTLLRPARPVFDESVALARVGGNREVLLGLIKVFYQDCNHLMNSLKKAIEHGDALEARTAAHTIKGMVAFFDAKEATKTAAQIEQAGGQGQLSGMSHLFDLLAIELSHIEAALSHYTPAPAAGWQLGVANYDATNIFSPTAS
jgi:CheY-like chemotaxis protein/HPt (histidine-containing phosphotransfer) domain-containing protein